MISGEEVAITVILEEDEEEGGEELQVDERTLSLSSAEGCC